ncbi:DUF222 domain-containing protein [Nocardioides sp.]|uniref:HNH endonuclease signature motif containing protein n=1 Tax=Nocardioides sp. TaxID=35761 RepID=UPI003514520F
MEMATPEASVAALTHAARTALGAAAGGEVWRLGAVESLTVLRELAELEAVTAALKAQVLVHAEATGAHQDTGAESVAVWHARATRTTVAQGRAAMREALALDGRPDVASALASAAINPAQVKVIVDAVAEVPEEDRDRASTYLLSEATTHHAKDLRVLGRRIWEVLDPVAADARESAALERQEARAAQRVRFSMVEHDDGTMEGWFRVPVLHGAMLRKMLVAIGAPKAKRAAEGAGSYDPTLRTPARWGQAFCDLIERIQDTDLPDRAGCGATVVVTMTIENLTQQLQQAGLLDTGEKISATAARRLAARAGIIPAVLDGTGMVLDWGHTRRFHTRAQRLAIATMHPTCVHPGCDVSASHCEIDHDPPWESGGGTDLTGKPRCPKHHRERQRDRGTDPPRGVS